MAATDLLLDVNNRLPDGSMDLLIQDGDFVLGPSDNQNIEDILYSNVGWWKQFPLVGVNINSYINSNGQDQALARVINDQLQADGFTVKYPVITINPNDIIIQPNAVRNFN